MENIDLFVSNKDELYICCINSTNLYLLEHWIINL